MGMNIQYSQKTDFKCSPVTLPRAVGQNLVAVTAGTGATAITAITAATGTQAFDTAIVSNPGCRPIRLTISYLTGGDCTTCTLDTYTVSTITLDIMGGVDSWELPQGYITNIDFVTLDVFGSTGVATNVTVPQNVLFHAQATTKCSDCVVLVP